MSEIEKNIAGVLLVDDEERFLLSASLTLKEAGIDPVYTLTDSREVMPFLEKQGAMVVVLDITMPHITGRELLSRIIEEHPHIPVIMLTAHQDIEMAVECIRKGARDYLVKPVEENRFVSNVKNCIEVTTLREEMVTIREHLLSSRPTDSEAFSRFITVSDVMKPLFKYIEAIAPSQHSVLITGETGVGKEIIANVIHNLSGRDGKFIALNVAGLDDNTFSDTLFGHERGAFTGADKSRAGLIASAAGGTLFLDEIGDLEPRSQIRLLRLLQEAEYYPLGSDVPRPSTARILTATNRALVTLVNEGSFRKDLFFRLRTHCVNIPPLRERKDDIPFLLEHFLQTATDSSGKKPPHYPPELLILLNNYHFPGNVRELEGMVSDALARHARGTLSMDRFMAGMEETGVHSSANFSAGSSTILATGKAPRRFTFTEPFPTIREAETFLIDEAMNRTGGNQTMAAKLLGITRHTLNKRLARNNKNSP
jgi:DNA-binding NtrC family response regulator